MSDNFYQNLTDELQSIAGDGLYKRERLITSKQAADIVVTENGQTREAVSYTHLTLPTKA